MKHVLGSLTIEQFLTEYWQKKPVLIRNAWPEFKPLLEADELAGMSLEEDIESRIIMEQGPETPWQLLKGPFTEETYQNLPQEKWTLLIQGVDQWIPEAADLIENFRFIPSWRIDDLMISYAPNGGSVGAHYDQYDVFLLQASGKRQWSTGQMCDENTPFLEEPQIRVLQDFQEQDTWVLEPGDMLYLPPRLAHHGIAVGHNCMTYSIGFRAPSQQEILDQIAIEVADNFDLNEDNRYGDPNLTQQNSTGEITQASLENARSLLAKLLSDDSLLSSAIGHLSSQAKYPDLLKPAIGTEVTDEELWQEITSSNTLTRDEMSRLSFYQNKSTEQITLFFNGESTKTKGSLEFIRLICDQRSNETTSLLSNINEEEKEILLMLYRQQILY